MALRQMFVSMEKLELGIVLFLPLYLQEKLIDSHQHSPTKIFKHNDSLKLMHILGQQLSHQDFIANEHVQKILNLRCPLLLSIVEVNF